jgi:hypothetical protein
VVSEASRPSPRHRKERFVHDETMEDRPRRRPVLLAMLVAAALLLAIAGSGAFGSGPSPSSDDSSGVQGAPPAVQQGAGGQGFTHHGRHCHHDHGGQQAPQQDPTGSPPV